MPTTVGTTKLSTSSKTITNAKVVLTTSSILVNPLDELNNPSILDKIYKALSITGSDWPISQLSIVAVKQPSSSAFVYEFTIRFVKKGYTDPAVQFFSGPPGPGGPGGPIGPRGYTGLAGPAGSTGPAGPGFLLSQQSNINLELTAVTTIYSVPLTKYAFVSDVMLAIQYPGGIIARDSASCKITLGGNAGNDDWSIGESFVDLSQFSIYGSSMSCADNLLVQSLTL